MRNNPKLSRYSSGKKSGGGGLMPLLMGLASAGAGAPSMANQALTADAMALPAEPMPQGFEGPVNAPTPYTGPQQYYAPDGQIVEAPFSDTRSWMDKARGVPDRAGEGNFQVQGEIARHKAIAPLELANAQESMRALSRVKQELHPAELAMQNATAEAKSMQEREAAKLALAQNQASGTSATPNIGFNSKNPSDVDFNYKGDPSEILDQPFIPYGEPAITANQKYAQQSIANRVSEQAYNDRAITDPSFGNGGTMPFINKGQGALDNQKYQQQNIVNRANDQAYADRAIVNPLSLGDGSGSPYNNKFLNTTPGGVEGNAKIAANQQALRSNQLAQDRLMLPELRDVGGTLVSYDPATGTIKQLAQGNAGKVVEGFDMTTGKPTSSVVGQSFKNFSPKKVGSVYNGAGVQNQPLEIDGGEIAQKYSGQRQNYVVGGNNTQTQTAQGAAPITPPPEISQLEGSIPDYFRELFKVTKRYDIFGRVIDNSKTNSNTGIFSAGDKQIEDGKKRFEENQKRLREKLAPYIRITPSK
jgi:hypothetical protein